MSAPYSSINLSVISLAIVEVEATARVRSCLGFAKRIGLLFLIHSSKQYCITLADPLLSNRRHVKVLLKVFLLNDPKQVRRGDSQIA